MEITVLKNLLLRTNTIQELRPSIWFLHGFGDSGLAYKEVFTSELDQSFNIYVIDLPGFGASPLNPRFSSMKSQAQLIAQIIKGENISKAPIYLVAHSIGALIGTWICQELDGTMDTFFSIEGNLTLADSYFSSKPLEYSSPSDFALAFESEIFLLAQQEERFRRYYSSLRLADPEAMWNWAHSSQEYVNDNKCGHEFKSLRCRKLYLWGDVDTPKETQEFIRKHQIENIFYPGIGHWHMHENADMFYQDLNDLIQEKN